MSNLSVARRYASALHAEAEAQGLVADVDAALALVGESLNTSRELRLFFASPVVSKTKKGNVIDKLFGERVPSLVIRFLHLLLNKGREGVVPEVVQTYQAMRDAQRGIIQAEARAAFDLSEAETKALTKALADVTGKDVRLQVKTDPALIGGLVVRVGDTVYDSSVRHQLGQLRAQLEEGSFLNN